MVYEVEAEVEVEVEVEVKMMKMIKMNPLIIIIIIIALRLGFINLEGMSVSIVVLYQSSSLLPACQLIGMDTGYC